MNPLDAAVAVGALGAFVGGWRLGLIQRLLSWIGLLGGLLVGSRIVAALAEGRTTTGTLVRAVAVLAACALTGHVAGHVVGARLRSQLGESSVSVLDSLGGALVGVVATLVGAWMVLPAMTQVPGWPADAARGSLVAGRLTRVLGPPPDALDGIGRALGLGSVFDVVADLSIDVGDVRPDVPVESPLDAATLERAASSTLRVQGEACGAISSGSSVVVLPGVVVTNAHVVAGGTSFRLSDDAGLVVDAELRAFDPVRDVAVLAAPGLDRAPLMLSGPSDDGAGAILGYPGGGQLRVSPYRIGARRTFEGTDIWGAGSHERSALVVGSRISPGVSGGPLVTPDGSVEGLAFGVAPDDPGLAYAIPADEVLEVLRSASETPVSSGRCTR